MIQDYSGNPTTAKKLAQDLLATEISDLVDYIDERLKGLGMNEVMTERERNEVSRQISKQGNRLLKVMGFEPKWDE